MTNLNITDKRAKISCSICSDACCMAYLSTFSEGYLAILLPLTFLLVSRLLHRNDVDVILKQFIKYSDIFNFQISLSVFPICERVLASLFLHRRLYRPQEMSPVAKILESEFLTKWMPLLIWFVSSFLPQHTLKVATKFQFRSFREKKNKRISRPLEIQI